MDVIVNPGLVVIDGDPHTAAPNERVRTARRVLDHLNVGIDTVGVLYPKPFEEDK